MARRFNSAQRPLWQQLGIWVLALGLATSAVWAVDTASSPTDTPPVSVSEEEPTAPDVPEDSIPSEAEAIAPEEPGDRSPEGPAEEEAEPGQTEAAPPSESTEGNGQTALDQLRSLPIKGRAPRTGFDREGQFGSAWSDVDRNGCDTRNDILARDLDAITRDSRCRVLTGTLTDPFSGQVIDFVRGEQTSSKVQIDHVVALSNAWQTGAQALTKAQRIALANDPLNLIAVEGRLNQQKGDSDAASWLPPSKPFRCEYVARQIGVKTHYTLWVTQAEFDQMERILATCPDFPALTPAEHGQYRPGALPQP
jgi:hypothetical protein